MKPSESQFQPADESAETTRHVASRFPNLLNARALQRLNKEEGYEFPMSGDELARVRKKNG